MIETVRTSEKGKTQLITLKRRTGIQNWNVLCRWAFCISLKDPPPESMPHRCHSENPDKLKYNLPRFAQGFYLAKPIDLLGFY